MKYSDENNKETKEEVKNRRSVKELLKDRKSRSIIILSSYAFFFLIISVMFRMSGPSTPIVSKPNNETISLKQMKNYEYNLKLNINGKEEKLYGKRINEKNTFIINDTTYYLVETNIYTGEEYLILDQIENSKIYKKLTPENLSRILISKNLDEEEKENSKIIKKYIINLKEYSFFIMNEIDETGIVKIETIEINGKIKTIKIDLNDIAQKLGLDNAIVEVEYYKSGTVEDFTVPPFNTNNINGETLEENEEINNVEGDN